MQPGSDGATSLAEASAPPRLGRDVFRAIRLPSIHVGLSTSFLLLLARSGGMLLGFALQAFLARALGAHSLGTYYTLVSLTGVTAVIGAVGYPVVASRFIARYAARNAPRMRALFLRIGLIDTAIMAALLASGVAAAGVLTVEEAEFRVALLIAALSIPPLAISRFLSAIANATRRFYVAYLPELVLRPAALLVLVGATAAVSGAVSVTEVIAYYAGISFAILAGQIAMLGRSAREKASPRSRRRVAPVWRKLAAILMVVPLLTAMLGDVDLLLLWPLLARTDIGVFGAALKMAMLFGFFVQVIHQTMVPDLAEALHRKRLEPALHSTVLANRLAFGFVLLAAAFVAMAGDEMLAIFGKEFVVARWALVILVLGLAPRAAAGPTAQLLVVMGREKLTVISGLLSVAYLAAANIALVPHFGLIGAAVAFTSMTALSTLLLSYLLWRDKGIRADIFRGAGPYQADSNAGRSGPYG